VLCGALSAQSPKLAVGMFALAGIVLLAFRYPVANLALLIVVTAVVPFSVLQSLSIGGGVGSTGLFVSDLLLACGLARALIVLVSMRLTGVQLAFLAATVLVLAGVAVQLLHGIARGSALGEAGNEARALLGLGTIVLAVPLLTEPARQWRLLRALLAVGLLLGVWGLAQYWLHLSVGDAADVGVRQGIDVGIEGATQLQGGLYAYPVAAALAFAALLSNAIPTRTGRTLVGVVLATNALCVLLTYERTFWFATVAACAVIALRAGRLERARALVLTPVAVVLLLVPLFVLSPGTLTTAGDRLLSLNQYGSDRAVSYRLIESRAVFREFRSHPLAGSGLGATVFWGRPLERVPASEHSFTHNGYLALIWKLGAPLGVALIALLFAGALRRGRPRGSPLFVAVAGGAQGALLGLLIANAAFPAVNALTITATMGTLLAFCALPR
jgi:hypothetical protein